MPIFLEAVLQYISILKIMLFVLVFVVAVMKFYEQGNLKEGHHGLVGAEG